MNLTRDMTEDDPRGILGMILFMVMGQMLMVFATQYDFFKSNVMLLNILDLDAYIVMVVHLLSAMSFLITIVVGLPKAWKEIRAFRIKRKRKKP